MTENYVETLKKSLLMGINSVGLILTENDGFDPKRPENSFFTPVDMVWPVLTRWTRFWSKMTVLTRNDMKLNFLPWSTWFDPYWPGELGFGRKWRFWPETHFLPWWTWFDPYWPGGLGFGRKWRFWPETHFLPWSTWFDPYWPGGLGFDGKIRLTREKYILNFKLFLNFFGFL